MRWEMGNVRATTWTQGLCFLRAFVGAGPPIAGAGCSLASPYSDAF